MDELQKIFTENLGQKTILIRFPLNGAQFKVEFIDVRCCLDTKKVRLHLKYRVEWIENSFSFYFGIYDSFELGVHALFSTIFDLRICQDCFQLGCSFSKSNDNIMNGEECSICLDRVHSFQLSCGHAIHKLCLLQLREYSNCKEIFCPICRKKIIKKDFQNIFKNKQCPPTKKYKWKPHKESHGL